MCGALQTTFCSMEVCFTEGNKRQFPSKMDATVSCNMSTCMKSCLTHHLAIVYQLAGHGKTSHKGWLQDFGIVGLSSIEVVCFLSSLGCELARGIWHGGQLGGKSFPSKWSRVRREPGCDPATLSVSFYMKCTSLLKSYGSSLLYTLKHSPLYAPGGDNKILNN